MQKRKVHYLLAMAILLATVLLVKTLFDERADQDHAERAATPAAFESDVAAATKPAAHLPAAVQPTTLATSASPNASATGTRAPAVRFELQAPSDLRVGESFEARVHVDASSGVRRLLFAVDYDRSRLMLLNISEGSFAQQSGLVARFETDEPSDGTALVTFEVAEGQTAAGVGTIAVLHFQSLDKGVSTITMHDLSGLDAMGSNNLKIEFAREATVTAR